MARGKAGKTKRGSAPKIPDRHQFKIGEVAKIADVKPHVLRFWESEFPSFKPQKTRSNQRVYRRSDVETVLLIKRLLYQEGFTIAGANKHLRELARQKPAREEVRKVITRVRADVESLLALVEDA